jgi:hypothetical protein
VGKKSLVQRLALPVAVVFGGPFLVLALPCAVHANPPYFAVDLTAATGAPAAAGPPVGDFECRVVPCGSRVVYETGAKHIEMIAYNLDSTHWKKFDLTVRAGAPLAACPTCTPAGRPWFDGVLNEVVYLTGAGHVEDLSMSGSAWKATDLSARTGAPKAATIPTGYFSDLAGAGEDRVIYSTATGDVEELSRPVNSTAWSAKDLTTLTGAPPATSAPFGFSTNNPSALAQVVYETASGAVEQLALSHAGSWQANDLTALAGAPSAAPGTEPVGYVAAAMRIIYKSASGSVIALSSTNETTWTSSNLNTITGAPRPIQGPRGYDTGENGGTTDVVVYKTATGATEEIYGEIGGSLTPVDVSSSVGGAPKAKSVPDGYDNNNLGNPETDGIVYETTSSHIELFYNL